MKRFTALTLLLLFLFCLSSCKEADAPHGTGSQPGTTGTTAAAPQTSVPTTTGKPATLLPQSHLEFSNPGKQRIDYNGNVSAVRYVTKASQLPRIDAFSAYNDTWFQDHALVLVTETVTSGSIDITFDSITVTNAIAAVTLARKVPENFTTDMATWYVWAEVEAGLDLRWTVVNPAIKPSPDHESK